jgi:D-alanyl-D-alanine carboxypeptidase (penicillin-binding protein 5/6)
MDHVRTDRRIFSVLSSTFIFVFAFLSIWPPQSGVSAAEVARYQPSAPPGVSADAVLVTDATTGTELFALNPDTPLPPASLTKIAAALVILEQTSLDDRIEILEDDLVAPEESQVGLVAGDRLSVRELLFGMLIPSGNDATLALARHVGAAHLKGKATADEAVAEFVVLMNEKAAALGATNSHFVNPTGIDAEGHVMSARDIATLTKVALQNQLFSEIVATPRAVLESEVRSEGYSVTSTNTLLLEGIVNGVKTGTTPKAGGCLVTSYLVGPNEVIAVVLGSDLAETADGLQDNSARFADTRALMDAVAQDFVWLDPLAPGVLAGLPEELQVWNIDLVDGELLPVPARSVSDIRYRLVLGPPAEPQQPAGEIQYYVGDQLLSERPALQAS